MSAKSQILRYLSTGRTLSTEEARNRFFIENVSARIFELREEGYPIYTNVRNDWCGDRVFVYRLGTPSRSMKAAAKARGVKLKKV